MLQAYCHCIQHVELYGPTNAAPIIRHVTNFAISAQQEEGQKGAHVSSCLVMPSQVKMLQVKVTGSPVELLTDRGHACQGLTDKVYGNDGCTIEGFAEDVVYKSLFWLTLF